MSKYPDILEDPIGYYDSIAKAASIFFFHYKAEKAGYVPVTNHNAAMPQGDNVMQKTTKATKATTTVATPATKAQKATTTELSVLLYRAAALGDYDGQTWKHAVDLVSRDRKVSTGAAATLIAKEANGFYMQHAQGRK